jgi:uncharacterized membrane protein YhaH (DUF805 family)
MVHDQHRCTVLRSLVDRTDFWTPRCRHKCWHVTGVTARASRQQEVINWLTWLHLTVVCFFVTSRQHRRVFANEETYYIKSINLALWHCLTKHVITARSLCTCVKRCLDHRLSWCLWWLSRVPQDSYRIIKRIGPRPPNYESFSFHNSSVILPFGTEHNSKWRFETNHTSTTTHKGNWLTVSAFLH